MYVRTCLFSFTECGVCPVAIARSNGSVFLHRAPDGCHCCDGLLEKGRVFIMYMLC